MAEFYSLLNPWLIFGIASVIVIILIIILSFYEIKLRTKLKKNLEVNTDKNNKRIDLLMNRSVGPQSRLEMVNLTLRQIFHELYGFEKDSEYSIYIRNLHKLNKKRAEEICDEMLKKIYQGEDVSHEHIDEIVKKIENLIEHEKSKNLEEAYLKSKKEINNLDLIELESSLKSKKDEKIEKENIILNAINRQEKDTNKKMNNIPSNAPSELIEPEDKINLVGTQEKLTPLNQSSKTEIDDKERINALLEKHGKFKKF